MEVLDLRGEKYQFRKHEQGIVCGKQFANMAPLSLFALLNIIGPFGPHPKLRDDALGEDFFPATCHFKKRKKTCDF